MPRPYRHLLLVALTTLPLAIGACSSDSDGSSPNSTTGDSFACVSPSDDYEHCKQYLSAIAGTREICTSAGATIATSCPATHTLIGCCKNVSVDACDLTTATGEDLVKLSEAAQKICTASRGTWRLTR